MESINDADAFHTFLASFMDNGLFLLLESSDEIYLVQFDLIEHYTPLLSLINVQNHFQTSIQFYPNLTFDNFRYLKLQESYIEVIMNEQAGNKVELRRSP